MVLPGSTPGRFIISYDIADREGVSLTSLVGDVFGGSLKRVYPFTISMRGSFVLTCLRGIGFIATITAAVSAYFLSLIHI